MGGMEDYYIAQFFCWREIILLNLEIDIETFSSVNLAKAGVYRYAESPDFEVLLFGYSVDGGEVKVGDLVKGEKIPEEVMSLRWKMKLLRNGHLMLSLNVSVFLEC